MEKTLSPSKTERAVNYVELMIEEESEILIEAWVSRVTD